MRKGLLKKIGMILLTTMKMKLLTTVMILSMLVGECSSITAFAANVNSVQSGDIIEIAANVNSVQSGDIIEIADDGELSEDAIAEIVDEECLFDEGYEDLEEDILGEDDEYIEIDSADELLALSGTLNSISGGKYILTQDIDMTGKDWIMPKHNPEEFDGDGHTISNLSISFSESPTRTGRYRCYGMFNNTSVKNLTLNNTTVNCNFVTFDNICAAMTGSGSAVNCILKGCTKFLSPSPETEITYVGGIVGMATDNVDRCILKGEIDCSDITYITSVAGIVGYVLAKKGEGGTGTFVRKCKTEEGSFIKINDSANSYVSGIAGCSETSSPETSAVVNFHDCENNASTNGPVFSGITYGVDGGRAGLSLLNCVNKANITLEKMDSCGVGIIHSSNGFIQLISCVNLGNITAQCAYGIIANLGTSSPLPADPIYVEMTSCANKGNITADSIAAGLAGKSYNAIIRESYNTGDICADSAAGLVEYLSSRNDYGVTKETEIRQCYNSGSVRGKNYAAGIVVRIEPDYNGANVDISDCFNSGIIYYYPDRKAYISGIVANPLYGRLNQEINITRCYNAGAVAPINDELFFSGNQIVGHLIVNSGVDGSTFTETDCFYYNDLNAKAMPRREEYDRLSSCVISEVAKSGEELKNIYTANSDIWRHGKAGYPYPYLKRVGEADLPTDFNHDRDVSRLDKLIDPGSVAPTPDPVDPTPDPVDPTPDPVDPTPTPIPEHVHDEIVDSYVAPSCELAGKSLGLHCSICGEVLKAQKEIAALGHRMDEGIVTKAATVNETGIITYSCTRTGCTHKMEKVIPTITESEDVVGEDVEILTNKEKPVTDTTVNVTGVKDATYTGSAVTFDLRVYVGKTLLKEGIDYSVKYLNNKAVPVADATGIVPDANKPQVVITGKGVYKDKEVYKFNPIYFKINPVNLEELEKTEDLLVSNTAVLATNKTKNSKLVKPVPSITLDGKKLNKKDYTVSYGASNEAGIDASVVGKTVITLTGKGNYTGSVTSVYEVVANPAVDKSASPVVLMSKVTVTGAKKSIAYDGGNEVKQTGYTVKAKVGRTNTVLTEGKDYTVTYTDNREIGTASMIIKAKAGNDKGLVGEKVVTFKITGTAMSKLAYSYEKKVDYTGATIKPGLFGQPSLTIRDNTVNKELIYRTDYEIKYLKNIQAGTATMLITGKGFYTGTVKKTFKITAVDLSKNTGIKADLIVGSVKKETEGKYKDKYTVKVLVTHNGKELKEGKDYTLSYKNNAKPGLATSGNKAPTVVIKGKGNFARTKSLTFDILE